VISDVRIHLNHPKRLIEDYPEKWAYDH